MSPVTRYRRIRCHLWHEPSFAALKDGEQRVALYTLSGPQTTQIGLSRFSLEVAAGDLRISGKTFGRQFATVLVAFGWQFDHQTHVLWIPEWMADNDPPNPNVVQSWRSAFDDVPDSALKTEAMATTRAFLEAKGTSFAKAFREPLAKPSGEPFRQPLHKSFG